MQPLSCLRALGVLALAWAVPGSMAAADEADPTAFSLERLLDVEVVSASKYAQKASEAPGNVTVVTAADIRTYGYRKLSDILAGIPGLYVSYDRNYEYLGVRGVRRFGDYSSRILLMVDGHRMNDTVYGTATIGTEFILDVDLIDHVEFVPGPGSSIYGSNAFFGVINVITKTGRDIRGLEAAAGFGDFGTTSTRLTYGRHDSDGLDLLASATLFDQAGRDLRMGDLYADGAQAPVSHGLDYDRHYSGFAKVSYGDLTVESAYSMRKKGIPTAAYGCVFDNPACYSSDIQGMVDIAYRRSFGRNDVDVRTFYGYYPYRGNYPYEPVPGAPVVTNRDLSRSDWWGLDVKWLSRSFDRHKLVVGAEYRVDAREDTGNYDLAPEVVYADNRHSSRIASVYLQDEMSIGAHWIVNAGVRHDEYDSFGGITDPRLALIYRPTGPNIMKLVYGNAFRAPNAYELYYYQPNVQKGNPQLRPERIRTLEGIFEHDPDTRTRLTASVYRYSVSDLINELTDPVDGLLVFRNTTALRADGMELAAERTFAGGATGRMSWSFQKVRDVSNAAPLTDSPRHLAKLNVAMPIDSLGLQAGLEAHYTSRRISNFGAAGGYTILNTTLIATRLARGLELSISAYNLLDRKYGDPASEDLSGNGLDVLPMNGRSLAARFKYRF